MSSMHAFESSYYANQYRWIEKGELLQQEPK